MEHCIQVLHMNGGEGDTSYAKNSIVQKKIISMGSPMIDEAIGEILCNKNMDFPASLGIADLGCSSGPNTLALISEVIEIVNSRIAGMGSLVPVPEIRVYLNDLPGNDFNNIFMSLPEFYRDRKLENCFVSCVAGSFHGRLFPKKSLHLVHSSSSLHWLSQVPECLKGNESINRGNIYISKSSPEIVKKAYFQQFQADFSLFLKCRSEEVVPGGRMVLSFLGRTTSDPTSHDSNKIWELLAQALNTMVFEGRIDQEKVESFNAPYYGPSMEEVRDEVLRDGSFAMDSLKAFEVKWDAGFENDRSFAHSTTGKRVAKTVRAVVESMLESRFGREKIMDDSFEIFARLVDDYSSVAETKYTNLVMSLTRK